MTKEGELRGWADQEDPVRCRGGSHATRLVDAGSAGRRRCVFTAAIIFGSTARPILTTAAALANVPADESGGGESIVLDDQP